MRRAVFRRASRISRTPLLLAGVALFVIGWGLLGLPWFQALILSAFLVIAFAAARAALDQLGSRLIVDDHGIEARDGKSRTRIAWGEISAVMPRRAEARVPGGVADLRYVIVADGRDGKLAFSDLSLVRGRRVVVDASGPVTVVDISEPEILLAIIARRTGHDAILDEPVPAVRASGDGARAPEPTAAPEAPGTGLPGGGRAPVRFDLAGLGALALKLGGKLTGAAAGLLKLVKPGLAVVTGGVYAVLFDWKFAIILMGMLLFHELGHVFAMRRCGLGVRGVYFIPFLGAAAVTEDTWKTRAQQAYIALNGPFWGFLLTLPVFALSLAYGKDHPSLHAITAWWSLLNLFNMLPINPLDGGRVVSALGYSIGSRLGVALSGAAFVASLAIALFLQVHLFAIVGLFGLMEFVNELKASRAAHRLGMASVGPSFSEVSLTRLRLLARPRFSLRDEVRLQDAESRRFARLLDLARVTPMSGLAATLWGLAYVGLAAAYVAMMIVASADPAASLALDVLR